MITKYSNEVMDDILKLIDINRLVELKIFKVSDGFNVQYLSLDDISFDKASVINAELLLDDTKTLTNIEKMQNILKEFKTAYEENRVRNFSVTFSCCKKSTCEFFCSVSFDSPENAKKKPEDMTVKDMLAELELMDERKNVPNLYIRNDSNKNRKYVKATVKNVRDAIMAMMQ